MVGRSITLKPSKTASNLELEIPSYYGIRSGWMAVGVVFISGFSLMGFTGKIIYDNAPPIPTFRLEGDHGAVLWTSEDVLEGQQIWQSIGGQQMGSVWGHGALQAPDWSADWLHREAAMTLELMGSDKASYIQRDLATEGAKDVEFLRLSDSLGVLAFAENSANDSVGECRLFVWRPAKQQFKLLQALATSGASDVEAFEPQSGEKGLLVVHEEDTEVYLADWEGEDVRGFAKIQSLGSKHGRDAEHVSWRGGRDFMVLALFRGEASYEVDSLVFEWRPQARLFSEVQRLPSVGAFDAELLNLSEAPRLLVANQRSGTSFVYEFGENDACKELLCKRDELSTPKVYNIAAHFVPEAHMNFLAVANYWD